MEQYASFESFGSQWLIAARSTKEFVFDTAGVRF
jgi:hypothetical protein